MSGTDGSGATSPKLRRIEFVLIAAVADNGVIGQGGDMPWRLKADLQHFRRLTMGKPLDGRSTIVASRDPALAIPGVLVAPSFAHALGAARGDALRRAASEIIIAGGAEIYAQAMPLADRLEITHVHARPDGDTLFPPIDPAIWREVDRKEPPGQRAEPAFTWATYARLAAGAGPADNHR